MKFRILIFTMFLLPFIAQAHGGVDDGHPNGFGTMDYIELGGIVLTSFGLMYYSYDKWRKDKNNKKPDQ
ncbi:MAG: hypothetical protein KW793_02430 [Candidatus Doudnabacteria bacterium]|nr:hypothetical protein [Candidatus Doudnabacteria bacterium]